jgi:hypothetical protein
MRWKSTSQSNILEFAGSARLASQHVPLPLNLFALQPSISALSVSSQSCVLPSQTPQRFRLPRRRCRRRVSRLIRTRSRRGCQSSTDLRLVASLPRGNGRQQEEERRTLAEYSSASFLTILVWSTASLMVSSLLFLKTTDRKRGEVALYM